MFDPISLTGYVLLAICLGFSVSPKEKQEAIYSRIVLCVEQAVRSVLGGSHAQALLPGSPLSS